MKYYMAGVYASNFHFGGRVYNFLDEVEKEARHSIEHILESYHYIGKGRFKERMARDGVRAFLDSGAFSAFTKGTKVDIRAYSQFVRDNVNIIEIVTDEFGQELVLASVLDVVGSAEKTWYNQRTMEDLGTPPLPCFHYGEPIEALEYYLENYTYITLGGMVPISTPQLITWLDRLWDQYFTDEHGRPKLRVHGFGLTSLTLAERYPWYSIDSSTWVQAAAMGGIMLPEHGVLSISNTSPTMKEAGRNFENLSPVEQEAVLGIIEERGFSLDRLQKYYQSRWAFNCWAYKTRLDTLHDDLSHFKSPQPELF
jgi:hypothetical protein